MAGKRIAQTAIDWHALAERVPQHQKVQFTQFKSKADSYLRAVLANPEKAPEIDWEFYKKTISISGLVDNFQKEYSAVKIPYPLDTVSSQIDALESEIKSDIVKFKSESDVRIAEYKKQLAHIASLIPYDQMTMEDFRDSYPDIALDPINRPTFWPHTFEEALDYHDPTGPQDDDH